MALKIMHDVETRDLLAGDVVIRNDQAQTFVAYVADEDAPGQYGEVHWRDGSYAYSTTAQPWNTWPIVVREV